MEVVAFQTFSMQTLTYAQARLAAFLFFSASGLAYGLFTARIPSLKEQTGAASDELGLVLFALGAASVVGLLDSSLRASQIRLRFSPSPRPLWDSASGFSTSR